MTDSTGDAVDVVIVGGGAAGTLTVLNLARQAVRSSRLLRITVVEPATQLGRGVAYAPSQLHRLNVPAEGISALTDDRDHFLRWVRTERPDALGTSFALRADFGRYLADTLAEALADAPNVELEHVRDRAVSVEPRGSRVGVGLAGGERLHAAAVVVAAGLQPPRVDWAPDALRRSPRFVPDPWSPALLDAVHADPGPDGCDDVLLVGSGLTAVDLALLFDRPDRVVHMTSRAGRLPRAHSRQALAGPPEVRETAQAAVAERVQSAPPTAAAVAEAMWHGWRELGNWRWAFEAVRPITQQTWQRLPPAEQAAFARQYGGWWDRHRHRMPPEVATRLATMRSAGRLTLSCGEVANVDEDAEGMQVTLSSGRQVRVRQVVNCTGPQPDPEPDSLLGGLLAAGLAVPDPLGLGVATVDGRLRDSSGSASAPVWTLGSTRRGELWESIAIPEIRVQARDVAAAVLHELTGWRPPTSSVDPAGTSS